MRCSYSYARSVRLLAFVFGLLAASCRTPAPDCRLTNTCPPADKAQCTMLKTGSTQTRTVTRGTSSLKISTTNGSASTTLSLRDQPYLRIESVLDPASQTRTTTAQFGSAFSGI